MRRERKAFISALGEIEVSKAEPTTFRSYGVSEWPSRPSVVETNRWLGDKIWVTLLIQNLLEGEFGVQGQRQPYPQSHCQVLKENLKLFRARNLKIL